MGTSETFCLQWNQFQNNLRESYRSIRKNEEYSDVTLVCGDGQQIEAHRIVLSNSSTFFRDLLKTSPNSRPFIYMRGISHGDIVSIVDFIYHGETEIGKDNLENFLEIAGELGVKGITKQSRNLSDELLSVSDKTEFVPVVTKPVKTALEDSKPIWSKNNDVIVNDSNEQTEKIGETSEKGFPCDLCNKTMGTKASLKTHKYNHEQTEKIGETSEKGFPCDLCNKTLGTKASLNTHKYNHEQTEKMGETSEKGFPCNLCNKTMGTKASLNTHKYNHEQTEKIGETSENGFPCDLCNKTLGTKASLNTHKYNHQKKNIVLKTQFSEKPEEESLTIVPLETEFSEKFKDESLTVDETSELDDTIGDDVDLESKIDALCTKKDGFWICLQCGKYDKSRFHLRRHVETHIEGFSYQCTICDKTLNNRNCLKTHMFTKHPEEKQSKPFTCDICNKSSVSKMALRIHKSRNHEIESGIENSDKDIDDISVEPLE